MCWASSDRPHVFRVRFRGQKQQPTNYTQQNPWLLFKSRLWSCATVRWEGSISVVEGSLCEPELRHRNLNGWLPVILPEHRAIGSPINTNIQEGGPIYGLISTVNLILWWMLFRWYKECCSFSGSRDHTAKPAGYLLIPWSSTFFSNPPHRCPLSSEKWKVAVP